MSVVLCRHADPQLARRRRRGTLGMGVPSKDTRLLRHYNLSLGRLPPSGLFIFLGRGAHARRMPRYFFSVVYPDLTELADSRGTLLQNDAAAIRIAARVFNDFCADRGNPIVIVKNEAGEVVYRYPTN